MGSISPIVGQYNKMQVEAVHVRPQIQQTTDRVELSHEAKLFTEAFSAVRKSMQENSSTQAVRVNQIMEQMRNGDYKVEVKDICDKLLS
ncbi:MAG: flagellar biosynthesis anti-sigma factor FlgM [Clostridia bacterium]|nr:flagellar biosynthesis anti-sigma factor FlgM [Clostridia bacterium]